jgi:hypothetical protein
LVSRAGLVVRGFWGFRDGQAAFAAPVGRTAASALIDVPLLAHYRSFPIETPFPTSTALRIRLGT